jgi:PAS domain S-box-containing protein
MVAPSYPYVDIVVLDAVRERFARGDGLVILTHDLETVIWGNGAGAALFGAANIEEFLGSQPRFSETEKRQLAAAGKHGGKAGVRLARGFSSRLVTLDIERIALPHGEPALLLVESSARHGVNSFDVAQATVEGFESATTHLAIVSRDGSVVGASRRFANLGVARQAIAAMCADIGREAGRLVKRPILTERGLLPAAVARLTDKSGIHLLMVVDEAADEMDQIAGAAPAAAEGTPSEPETTKANRGAEGAGDAGPEPAQATRPEIDAAKELASPTVGIEPEQTRPARIPGLVRLGDNTSAVPPTPEPAKPARQAGDYDRWYFDSGVREKSESDKVEAVADKPAAKGETLEQIEVKTPAVEEVGTERTETAEEPVFAFDPAAGPVRFVWKTAPDGSFREVSPEFAQAVGPNAADIVGRRFADVANVFALDGSGEIAGLVSGRDTWSGRTVMWPVQGTDMKVPVDLAALPVYDRNRQFDGFRGFGVARMGDAVIDAEAIGLSLTNKAPPIASAETAEGQGPDGPAGVAVKVMQPARESAAKVVSINSRRKDRVESELSPAEVSAFREIGDRLASGTGTLPTAGSAPERPNSKTPSGENEAVRLKAEAEAQAARADEGVRSSFNAPPIAREGYVPAAFAKGDGPGHATLDEDVLAILPIAIVVHDGHDPQYINEEFLRITGYRNLNALRKAGGLDVLFVEAEDPLTPRFGSPVRLRTANGDAIAVEARLHSIRWRDGVALLLSMRPSGGASASTAPVAPDAQKPPLSVVRAPKMSEARPDLTAPVVAIGAGKETRPEAAEIRELKAILDTATDGVIVLDAKGGIRSMNRSAQALFGYEADEMAGEPFELLFSTDSRNAARDYLDGLSENGITSVLNDGRELTAREKKGRFIPVFMTMGRLQESDGFCAVLRDITPFKRTEVELEKARKNAERTSEQKSEFLARVSHEVRTPLNAIIGFSEIMLAESFGPIGNQRYRDYLEDIYTSGNHVLQIINDLLDISKIEAGQQELNYEAVPLNDIVAECVSIMQPAANRERVIMRTSLSPAVPEIVADLRSIRQIALNLLSNAIRFTPAGGQIIVSTTYEKNGEVALRVRDTGVGMSDAEIEQALKPFKQVPSAKSRQGDGTGLGLPLTKAMTEANRAVFSIQSAKGEGTMVAVTFPSTRVLAD